MHRQVLRTNALRKASLEPVLAAELVSLLFTAGLIRKTSMGFDSEAEGYFAIDRSFDFRWSCGNDRGPKLGMTRIEKILRHDRDVQILTRPPAEPKIQANITVNILAGQGINVPKGGVELKVPRQI